MKNKNTKKRIFEIVVYALTFALVFILLLYADRFSAFDKFIEGIENKTFDLRQSILMSDREHNSDIVIVTIDDPSYEYIVNNYSAWPAPRSLWAELVDTIEKAKPKYILFDLLFTARLKNFEDADLVLIDAIKNNKNVFVPFNFDYYDKEVRTPPVLPDGIKLSVENGDVIKNSKYLNFPNSRPPMKEILEVTDNVAAINVTRSEDGILREYSPMFYYQGDFYPSLALAVVLDELNLKKNTLQISKKNEIVIDNNHIIPLTKEGRIIPNWYGKAGTYEYIPYWQIGKAIKENDEKFINEKFANKYVLIGVSTTSLSDIKSVPVEENLPGVETHATILNNMLDSSFIKKTHFNFDILISLMLCLLVGFFVLRLESVIHSTLSSIIVVILYLMFSVFVMDKFNLWIGVVWPTLFSLSIFIFAYIAKYLLKSKDYEHTYRLAVTDGLTDMYNHRYFQEQMINNLQNVARYGGNFSLVLIDIDFFKKFNDTYGHQSGDAVLRQVATTIKKSIRSSDIACRYGGEEMAVILTNTNKEDAILAAKKIWQATRERQFELADGGTTNVTISVGVATAEQDGTTTQELIEYADKCLYKAKQEGRDRVISEI